MQTHPMSMCALRRKSRFSDNQNYHLNATVLYDCFDIQVLGFGASLSLADLDFSFSRIFATPRFQILDKNSNKVWSEKKVRKL